MGTAGILGGALTAAANGYLRAILEEPLEEEKRAERAQRQQLRPIELEQARLKVEEARRKVQTGAAASIAIVAGVSWPCMARTSWQRIVSVSRHAGSLSRSGNGGQGQ